MARPVSTPPAGARPSCTEESDVRRQAVAFFLGDAAFMGPGQTLYVLKGDTEIQLQILDVTDPGIMDKTNQLAKIILGRL